jgi:hypothetical protein
MRETGAATMKTMSRWFCEALVGMSVLGLIVKGAAGDEMADWMAQQRRQNEEYHRQWQQWREEQDRADREAQAEREARDRAYYEAQAQQEARDKAYKEAEETQKERDAWYKWQEEQRQWYENERRQKEWDEWMGRSMGSADWGPPSGQMWFLGHRAPQSVVIFNPFVLKQKSPEEQEKVRQQATEMGQQIMSESQALPQLIENPFVRKPK